MHCTSNKNKPNGAAKKALQPNNTSARPKSAMNASTKRPKPRTLPKPQNPNPYQWNKKEVAMFIAHIGYPEYRENFIHDAVDGKALLCLDDSDFADIGIYALGHRKIILQRVQKLRNRTMSYAPNGKYDDWEYKSPYPGFDQEEYWREHPQAFSKDKARDKETYYDIWSQIVQHRDFMLETQYSRLVIRSGLSKADIDIIWKLATQKTHGKCHLEQFADIMKLAYLSQNRVPLYLINVPKLIFYHPPLVKFFKLDESYSEMQEKQVNDNMVGFYGLPNAVLDSDTKLMDLEKNALRPYKPIHFEINAKVLIATFQQKITQRDIKDLQQKVHATLKNHLGLRGNVSLHDFRVQRPSFHDLGMTPGGANDVHNIDANVDYHQRKHQNENGHTGLNPQNGVNLRNGGGHGGRAPAAQHNNGNAYNNHNNNNNNTVLQNSFNNKPKPKPQPKPNIAKMQKILASDNFWEEFRQRSQIDQVILDDETLIRTRQAMHLLSKLRGVPVKAVKFTDKGVRAISSKSKPQLEQKFNQCSIGTLAAVLGIPEDQIPEMYQGIVIEGLPHLITADDENIRKLDQAVLNEFIVSHIEVVDTVLRITFATEVQKTDINQLRKYLKMFLKNEIRLEKQQMKQVSIIPHTRGTWKGETTEKSVEQGGNAPYYNMDSVPNRK